MQPTNVSRRAVSPAPALLYRGRRFSFRGSTPSGVDKGLGVGPRADWEKDNSSPGNTNCKQSVLSHRTAGNHALDFDSMYQTLLNPSSESKKVQYVAPLERNLGVSQQASFDDSVRSWSASDPQKLLGITKDRSRVQGRQDFRDNSFSRSFAPPFANQEKISNNRRRSLSCNSSQLREFASRKSCNEDISSRYARTTRVNILHIQWSCKF